MLEPIFEFFQDYIWSPLGDLSSIKNLTINGVSVTLVNWLTTITTIVVGVLIIYALIMLLIKVFKWFFGLIGR